MKHKQNTQLNRKEREKERLDPFSPHMHDHWALMGLLEHVKCNGRNLQQNRENAFVRNSPKQLANNNGQTLTIPHYARP